MNSFSAVLSSPTKTALISSCVSLEIVAKQLSSSELKLLRGILLKLLDPVTVAVLEV